MRTSMRHTGGALTVVGITLILIATIIGSAAVPAGAAQKNDLAATTSTTVDPKDTPTTTTKVDPKDTTTTTTKFEAPALAVSGTCGIDGATPYFSLEVTVFGDPGATGHVTSDSGASAQFTIGDQGFDSVVLGGHVGVNTVTARDTSGGTRTATTEIADCAPTPMTAEASAFCDKGDRLVVVAIHGEPGHSGIAFVDDQASRFILDTEGSANLVVGAATEDTTVQVQTEDGTTVLGPTTVTVEDCGESTTTTQVDTTSTTGPTTTTMPTTTTQPTTSTTIEGRPAARSANADGTCSAVGATPIYTVRISVHGDPGATGTVTVDGATHEYLVFDQGSAEMVVAASSQVTDVSVTDAVAGTILDTQVTVVECVKSEVLGADDQSPAGPSIQVLAQGELPFTGPHDGPIAATGAALLVLGALLLLATRPTDEEELDLTIGWTVRR